MLMDEPFGALDAMTREGLQDELARLVREQGLTVMFVTHDLEEALYLGDRVIALRSNPTLEKPSLAAVIDVPLPLPREQLATKEHPEFLRLRRELYQYLGHHEPPRSTPCPHCPPRVPQPPGSGPAAAANMASNLRPFVFPAVLLAALELWARTTGRGSDALAPPSAAVRRLARR
jgi:hypothetical protein